MRANVSIISEDLPEYVLKRAIRAGRACCDIETSGLDWRTESIGTFQVAVPGTVDVFIVAVGGGEPKNLKRLLESESIAKIFHHAMFDLRFLVNDWRVTPRNIACTKIASKIASPDQESHSLQDLVRRHLGIKLDKGHVRHSDWCSGGLSEEQVRYAAGDVKHLDTLYNCLCQILHGSNRWELAKSSFEYLPVRVRLDLLGVSDVYQY
jgi:ribonuclease D